MRREHDEFYAQVLDLFEQTSRLNDLVEQCRRLVPDLGVTIRAEITSMLANLENRLDEKREALRARLTKV